MGLPVKYCMYYDKRTHEIIDFLPKSIPQNIRNNIIKTLEKLDSSNKNNREEVVKELVE